MGVGGMPCVPGETNGQCAGSCRTGEHLNRAKTGDPDDPVLE